MRKAEPTAKDWKKFTEAKSMKFTCSAEELTLALLNATRALSGRPAIPIMEGALVQTGENQVSITCTDGSVSICSRVSAIIREQGSVVLPGKLFAEIVRKLPEGTVSFQMNSNMSVVIQSKQSKSTLSGNTPAEFPQVKEVQADSPLKFPQKRLKNMISRVTFAIPAQETRQILTGCLMEVTGSDTRLVGLDGFRLAIQTIYQHFQLPNGKDKVSAVIPGYVMTEIGRIMNEDEEEAYFHFDKTHLMVEIGNTTLTTALLAGEYIDYKQILPTTWQTRVTVNRKDLEESLDRAGLIAREGKNNLVRMKIQSNKLIISSMSELGNTMEELDILLEGKDMEIAFNSRYISEVIKSTEDENCTMSLNTSISPCVIAPVEGDSYLYLVLPVRMSS